MPLPLARRALALAALVLASAALLSAPALADPADSDLPCTPTSWSHGCGEIQADGTDGTSGQPAHGNYKDADAAGSATLTVTFSGDGTTATFTGNRALSNYTVALCDGTIVDVESVGGEHTTFTFSYATPIRSVRVKAATTNRTFLSGACDDEPGGGDPGGGGDPTPTTLAITKASSVKKLEPGESATFTIEVRNTGAVAADDARLCDEPDDDWTYVSAEGAVPVVTGDDVCFDLGTIAAGAAREVRVTLRLDADARGWAVNRARAWADNAAEVEAKAKVRVLCVELSAGTDRVSVQKVESFVGLAAGEEREVELACPSGFVMTDGAPRVDAVDQGTGTPASVRVLTSRSIAPGTYAFALENTATGQAQVHVFGTCLRATTDLGAALDVSGLVTTTVSWGAGRHTATLPCPSGSVPIAPGYELVDGDASIVTSEPDGASGWKLGFDVDEPATVALSIRCLGESVGDERLAFSHVVREVDVAPGQAVSESVVCGDQAKGVVASFDLAAGLLLLGHDPQPKTRVFSLLNPGATPLHAVLDLVCLEERTVVATSCAPASHRRHGAKLRGAYEPSASRRTTR
ncbi:MAG TPA: hypothetical protein VFR97_00170 [Capillimicrobium sp.]|nr:hypothetical protein [Capillimicrobium sp.]